MVATLTELPPAPDPNSPGQFNTLAYPFTVAQRDMVTELNGFIATLNSTYWPATPVTAMIDGTAAAPAYSWNADTNLGIYRAGADRLAVTVNGAQAMEFNASGAILAGLLSGTAVIQSATDTTAGRLLTTGAGPSQAFKRTNILGTVSQSGGVPTGALIENGSNANGEYVRFADGLQICTGLIVVGDVTTAAGSLFTSPTQTWTFPAAFASVTGLSPNGMAPSSVARWTVGDALTASNWTFRVFGATSSAAASNARLFAVGRWF